MKNISKGFLFTVLLLALTMTLPIVLFAQGPGPDPDAPIDGGLSLLIAAGVGYGAKKIHDAKKKKQAESNKQEL